MINANTAYGVQLLAAQRSNDDLRVARQYRLAKQAHRRREAAARRARLLRFVVGPVTR